LITIVICCVAGIIVGAAMKSFDLPPFPAGIGLGIFLGWMLKSVIEEDD
jgi:hypothetical protein